jgi:hypothetical protein
VPTEPIPWSELLRRTFGVQIVCQKCQSPLHLIALIKSEDIANEILTAMHLPTEVPELHPTLPPPWEAGGGGDDWVNCSKRPSWGRDGVDCAVWSRHAFQEMPEVPGAAKRGPHGWDAEHRGAVTRCGVEVLERRKPIRND